MYNYICGKIAERGENFIVIEAAGIGYELTVSTFCLDEYPKHDEIYRIPVYLNVKEDEMRLFGFKNNAEKLMFKRLIQISGIGPKVAIATLSGIPLDELTVSILNRDTNKLSKIKGIGKKTAERMVLELKDKFSEEYEEMNVSKDETDNRGGKADEAIMALISLGFNKSEAIKAVAKVSNENLTLEEMVFKALKGK